jgi:hypothetical protein
VPRNPVDAMATHSRWPDILSAIAHARCQRTRRATNARVNARAAQNPAFARPRRDVRVHARCTTNSRAPYSKDQRGAHARRTLWRLPRSVGAGLSQCRDNGGAVRQGAEANRRCAGQDPDRDVARSLPATSASIAAKPASQKCNPVCAHRMPTYATHAHPHQAATPPSERGSVPPCNMPLASRRIAPAWPTASSNAPSTSTS